MIDTSIYKKLPQKFYIRPATDVAKDLLGKILVKKEGKKVLSGRIVEVEAYDGKVDEAAHSFRGKTKRNEVMFYEGGFFYVYFTYGAHHCCNVVTDKTNHGAAVLIRAVEPIDGINLMIKRRFNRNLKNDKEIFNLASGPGKVCKAFGFDLNNSGTDLTKDQIFIVDQPKLKRNKIGISKRIGITKSIDLPWRFFEIGNSYLSR